MSKNVTNYELMVIIDPGIGQASIDKQLDSLRKQINKYGKIFFEDLWGERDLAYTMGKNDKGYYAVFDFSFDPEQLNEFEKGLVLEPEIIRHLIVRLPATYESKTMEELAASHQEDKSESEKV